MSHALQAAFLGIVQGLTEFLPVSSTAHLLISEKLIGFDDPDGVFAVMIQLGSILAVVWLYRVKILEIVQTLALSPGVSRSGATIVGGLVMGLDRPAAAEFSFFLAIPTMTAAFAHQLLEVRHHLGPERAGEIAVGFVMAFLASVAIVKP